MNEKKLRQSPVVIVLYVFAVLGLAYSCYLIGNTVSYINSYYDSYGMTAETSEIITYVLQTVFQPLMLSVLAFAGAVILNEVRALNPANYASDDEIAQAKAAKAAKKAAKAVTEGAEEVKADAETVVFGAKEEVAEVKANMDMKKSELLAIAKDMGIEVNAKATKAEILAAIESK